MDLFEAAAGAAATNDILNEACTLAEIANPTNVITDDGIVIELIDEQKTVGEDSKNDIFDVIDTIQCKEEQNVQFDTVDGTAILGAMNGFGAGAGFGTGVGAGFTPVQAQGGTLLTNISVQIIEQPAPNKLRFRYECEGRSAGALSGITSTSENKTFPAIKINGYQGPAVVVVSCVEDKPPFRTHPHNLVGKGSKKGVCSQEINTSDMTAQFTNLGIQCVKKKESPDSLKIREEIRVDPFKQGFAHRNSGMNLNAVRLCFQVFLRNGTTLEPLNPVVSNTIFDAKAHKDLSIMELSDDNAPIEGGKKILLFCEKISKDDIEIHFRYFENGQQQLLKGHFTPNDVHHQYGISFTTPPFPNQKITQRVKAEMFLYKPTNQDESIPREFYFVPKVETVPQFQQPAPVKPQKRTKAATKNTSNQEDSEPSSRALQVPAKNRQSSSGGRMIIKENEPERQSFTDQVINATEPLARAANKTNPTSTIDMTDIMGSGSVGLGSEAIPANISDLVRDVIENEDNKVDPNFFDQLSDNLSNVKIESSPTKNSQLETPDVSMDISKSSKMNNLNF